MNKLPVKQIYLLIIIVIGILSLSIYSTYSIFTMDQETDDIVNFTTPNSLDISDGKYEYQQIIVPKNSYKTADIDIYNYLDEDICYSVWYKISTKDSKEKVKVYQYTSSGITATGTLEKLSSRRITLILTNDYDYDVKVNFGYSYSSKDDTCKLNISSDKSLVLNSLSSIDKLSDKLQKEEKKDNEDGYLLYEDYDKSIKLDNIIYVSSEYTLSNEVFTLKDYKEIDLVKNEEEKDEDKKFNYNDKEYYTCLDGVSCQTLYKINNIKLDEEIYYLDKYDKLFSYTKGESGIRKVDNDYIYYGDNPNNFIYYNCENNDVSSCELWRILGIYYDEEEDKYVTKIIRNESISRLSFNDDNNEWLNSSLDKYLNDEYKINDTSSYKFLEKYEYINDNEMYFEDKNNDSIIRVMRLNDYLNASVCTNKKINEFDNNCLKENWLNTYNQEWTLTYHYLESISVDEDDNEIKEIIKNKVFTVGNSILSSDVTKDYDVRPVLYLTDRVFLVDGDGTISNPYVIK